MKFKKYYSLREVIGYLVYSDLDYFKGKSSLTIQFGDKLYYILEDLLTASIADTLNFVDSENDDLKDYAKQVINSISDRFGMDYCVCIAFDGDSDSSEIQNLFTNETIHFIDKLSNILSLTFDKYSYILNSYTTHINDLLLGLKETQHIESSSSGEAKSRFNDTPQNYEVDGEWNDDDHSTNEGYSTNSGSGESEVTKYRDNLNMLEKLDQLNDLYDNVILRWSNEFRRLFIPYTNIGGKYEG